MSAFEDVSVGEELPPLKLTITLQRLVMEAGANRDFSPIHFDGEVARESGAPDVFANTTFNETLLEATIRQWAGLAARIRVIEFAMKDFNCVGDVVSGAGVVTSTTDDERTVELAVWIESERGRTVEGTATVAFP